MIRELKSHAGAYFLLFIILSACVAAFLAAWPNHAMQRMVAVVMGVAYSLWGVVTHFQTERITRKVIVEYVVIGLFASVLLILVTV